MLCHACRVHLHPDHPYCLHCGTLRRDVRLSRFGAPQLRRVDDPVDGPVDGPAAAQPASTLPVTRPVTTIGRDPGNDLVLDDPSVSRRHARIVRRRNGFVIEDLDSFNGTTVSGRTIHGNRASLPDPSTIYIGDVGLEFAQPRSAAVGSKTMVAGTDHAVAKAADSPPPAPTATEPLSVRPHKVGGWALKRPPDARAAGQWVLRNTRTGQYLQLDERDVFLWRLIDGENTVRDLLFAYAQEYGELALPRIEQTLRALAGAQLVRGLHGQRDPRQQSLLRRAGRALFRALLQLEISVRGLDRVFAWIYRRFGWWFFTRTGGLALWVLIGGGVGGFWVATGRQRLLDLGGAGGWGVVAIAGGYLAALAIHESAHALAVKSYGRTVSRGGFLLMLGMPFAFVDTSDMWFGSRWSRIVVTLAGPLSTAGVAGAAALVAAYLPHPAASAVCFQLAFGLYLNTLYNLNPLMPLDGYQALSDALRRPRLREEATAYFTSGLWRDLRLRRRPGLRQLGLAGYGLLAVVGLTLFTMMAFLAWNSRLGELVTDHLRPPLDTVVVVLGLAVALFPIWYRIARWLTSLARRHRRGEQERRGEDGRGGRTATTEPMEATV
jgi:putative peptide zinc metalloprotease protein